MLERAASLSSVGGDGLVLTNTTDPIDFLIGAAMEDRLSEHRARQIKALATQIISTLGEAMK